MEHLLFIGQNASTGQPHPVSGRMSFFGWYYKFKSREDRQAYLDNHYPLCGSFRVSGTRGTLRKYSLGSTWEQYNREIDMTEYKNIEGDD